MPLGKGLAAQMIAPIRWSRDVQRTQRSQPAKSADFAPTGGAQASTAATPRGLGPAGPVGSLDALIALQSVGERGSRRSRAARRGAAMLDDLDALKLRLLEGRVEPDLLDRLAGRLAGEREAADLPELDGLLADIELRVQVELAKLGR